MTCIKCGESRETEFYPSRIKNHSFICKVCCYAIIREWRERNLDKYRKYQRNYMRNHLELNKTCCKRWFEKNKELHYKWRLKYAQSNPQRHRAQCYAYNAFPDSQVCEVEGCFELGQRHHDNYDKPLDIRWLCRKHHKELSRKYEIPVVM